MDRWLLCDFHIHTNMSDGNLSLREVVDLYGQHGFDVIAITDHIFDREYLKRLKERGTKVPSLDESNFREYLRMLAKERDRAWREYNMLLIPGFEVTNNTDYYHIVALDVPQYIDPSLEVVEILEIIRECGGVSIAAHPGKKNSDREHLSKHLYENMDFYGEAFDAWEIGNQFDLYNEVIEKRLRFVASSDFHHMKHFSSWRTLIKVEKDPEAVKEAIKRNEEVAILFFKPGMRADMIEEMAKAQVGA